MMYFQNGRFLKRIGKSKKNSEHMKERSPGPLTYYTDQNQVFLFSLQGPNII